MNPSNSSRRGSETQSTRKSPKSPAQKPKAEFSGKETKQIVGEKNIKQSPIEAQKSQELSSRTPKSTPKEQPGPYITPPSILHRAAHLGGLAAGNLAALPKAFFTGIIAPTVRTAGDLSYQAATTFIPIAAEQLFNVLSLGEIPPENLSATADAAAASVDMIADQATKIIDRNAEAIKKTKKFIKKAVKSTLPPLINELIKQSIKEADPLLNKEYVSVAAFCISSIVLNNLNALKLTNKLTGQIIAQLNPISSKQYIKVAAFYATAISLNNQKIPDDLFEKMLNIPLYNLGIDSILVNAGISDKYTRIALKKSVMVGLKTIGLVR